MIDTLGRVRLTRSGAEDSMLLATMRDLGGVDLSADEIAEAIGARCNARPPHKTDVVGRLCSLRSKGIVWRHEGVFRGGWQIAPEHRDRLGVPASAGRQASK